MKKISYDTTNEGHRGDEKIFEIFGYFSANGIVKRDTFDPNVICTLINENDVRHAESVMREFARREWKFAAPPPASCHRF